MIYRIRLIKDESFYGSRIDERLMIDYFLPLFALMANGLKLLVASLPHHQNDKFEALWGPFCFENCVVLLIFRSICAYQAKGMIRLLIDAHILIWRLFLSLEQVSKVWQGDIKSEVGACWGSRTCNKMYSQREFHFKKIWRVSEWNWNISPNKRWYESHFSGHKLCCWLCHTLGLVEQKLCYFSVACMAAWIFLNYQIRYSDLSGSEGSLFGQMNSNL